VVTTGSKYLGRMFGTFQFSCCGDRHEFQRQLLFLQRPRLFRDDPLLVRDVLRNRGRPFAPPSAIAKIRRCNSMSSCWPLLRSFVAASLTGGLSPGSSLTHRRMQLMMSFVGGLMLGVAFASPAACGRQRSHS
jgi:hypothetical protein